MKNLMYLLTFLFIGTAYAQVTPQTPTTQQETRVNTTADRTMGNNTPTYYNIEESSDYTFNNQSYRFSPDERGINISRMENGRETPVGNLRQTTADGYYIMTSSTDPNDISFGSFEPDGNFRTYRYDRDADTVYEEYYSIDRPRDIRGENYDQMMRDRNIRPSNRNSNDTNPMNNNRNNK